jgi:hypothetical protein
MSRESELECLEKFINIYQSEFCLWKCTWEYVFPFCNHFTPYFAPIFTLRRYWQANSSERVVLS